MLFFIVLLMISLSMATMGIWSTNLFKSCVYCKKKKYSKLGVLNLSWIYLLQNCDINEICQVFICETGTIISGRHVEINVSLAVDLANIPLPEVGEII